MSKAKDHSLVGKIVEFEGAEYAITRVGEAKRGMFVWVRDSLGAPFTVYPADLDAFKVIGKAVTRDET